MARVLPTRLKYYGPEKANKSICEDINLSLPPRRNLHCTGRVSKTVKVIYVDPMGDETTIDAEVGKNLLEIAHEKNIELEGACGGELACATCHLVFEKEIYVTLPEKEPEEDDMLDLAMELTDTSRLGCQICVTKDMDGMRVVIPDDGY